MSWYQWQQHSLVLFCHLQPRASRDEFAGLHGERLKVRIKAAPIDGKANAALVRFIAAQFGVPQSAVSIVSGSGGRQKTVVVSDPRQLPEGLDIKRGE